MSEHIKLTTFKTGRPLRNHKMKIRQRLKGLVKSNSRIRKDHWEPDKENPTCVGCNRRFKVYFRRHHCRLCGKVYCHHCSRYKMRLDENARASMDGRFHRVCFHCKGDMPSRLQPIDEGLMTSWIATFRFLREESQRRSSSAYADISMKQYYADVIKTCRPAVDIYIQSCKKKEPQNILTRAIGDALNATTELGRSCSQCNKDLVNPTKRRQCVICKSTLCKPCTFKDLVIYSNAPNIDNTPDINIAFLGYFKENEIEVSFSQTFRVCESCRNTIQVEDKKARFNEQLYRLHANLIHLRYQICESVNQIQDGVERRTLISKPNSPLIMEKLQRSLSMFSLESWSELDAKEESSSKHKIRISGINMSKNLLDDFFKKYQELLKLEFVAPTTTHGYVFQNISRAMSSFYNHSKHALNHYTNLVNETAL